MSDTSGAGLRDRSRWIWVAIGVGFVGSALAAAASFRIGARVFPRYLISHVVGGAFDPSLHPKQPYLTEARMGYFVGLALMTVAFLYLGRLALGRHPSLTWRIALLAGVLWAIPMVFSQPLGSRDVWAYFGQGLVLMHDHNPYKYGPIVVHGPYLQQVDPVWAYTPAPYGPLFVLLAGGVATAVGPHVFIAAVVLRIITALIFAGGLLAMVPLCRRLGASPEIAIWLLATNPFFLVLGVSAGHNDLIALGLLAVGLWLTTNAGSVWKTLLPGAVVLTASAEVKAQTAVVLAFLPFIWLAHAPAGQAWRTSSWPRVKAVVFTAVTALIGAGIVAFGTGLGFGWVERINARASGTSLLSIPKVLAMIAKYVKGDNPNDLAKLGKVAVPIVGGISLASAAIVLLLLWALAWRGRRVVALTAIALAAAQLLSTTVQPWYFFWVIAVTALLALPVAAWEAIAVVCIAFTVAVQPAGKTVYDNPVGIPLMATVAAISLVILRVRRTTISSARARAVKGETSERTQRLDELP